MYLNIKLELPQIDFDPVPVEEHHIPSPPSVPALPPSLPVTYSSEDALQGLRRVLHKPEATWSNEGQKQAVMACLQWTQDLVVVLPTGSGKSAIIATATSMECNKVTVILCPLRSLLSDWERRLKSMRIQYEVFSSLSPRITGQAPIILVSLDSTIRSYWHQAVASLRSDITLNRYVVDEAHLILTEAAYRDVMQHIKELRNHCVQMVLLSATIAPRSIATIRQQANIASGSNALIIRASSNRPELYFQAPQAYSDFATVCALLSVLNLSNISQL